MYIYGLYMAAGWADRTETSEWCKNVVKETAEWMCKLSTHKEPDLLLNCHWVLSIEGILSMSWIVPKKAECLNDDMQKDKEFGKPIAIQYCKNPAEFNKALVLTIDTISCDHANKEKLGMADLPVTHGM
ncbi:hypothetical protein BU17DRAFT_69666 [Hysterangium stoloniferum]|nr:hypothetical protein BU17DRAFT_69666 [Hysterangium stoloniferum]